MLLFSEVRGLSSLKGFRLVPNLPCQVLGRGEETCGQSVWFVFCLHACHMLWRSCGFLPELVLYAHGLEDTVIFKAQKLMLLKNRLHRDEVSMGGYRILYFIIFSLGSVPESLPSALAWEELQLSTKNQLHHRQNAVRYEPHILQITELFPLRCNKTTKFSLHCISWWVDQAIRSRERVHQDPVTISKTWHPVLLLIFSSLVSFLLFPSYIFCGSYIFIF